MNSIHDALARAAHWVQGQQDAPSTKCIAAGLFALLNQAATTTFCKRGWIEGKTCEIVPLPTLTYVYITLIAAGALAKTLGHR